MPRALLGINCFGAGVFFGILGCELDPTLHFRNPPWWCAFVIVVFLVLAALPEKWRPS